jgi:hypothetical protein
MTVEDFADNALIFATWVTLLEMIFDSIAHLNTSSRYIDTIYRVKYSRQG